MKSFCAIVFAFFVAASAQATPANKKALALHLDKFLPASLNACTTCHLPSKNTSPESLDEFPHNAFGTRLRELGTQLRAGGKKADIPTRLAIIAREDSDGDGVDNLAELLLGRNPGDAKDVPSKRQLADAGKRRVEFEKFLASYRWKPFEPVQQPAVPVVRSPKFEIRNPVDAFLAIGHQEHGLKPRPPAGREVLLRRVYLDLIGLSPTPKELAAFLADKSPTAYEDVVDRLLNDPRHGERWARHWMDVWRYSDWAGWTGGNQIRDSQPHIWRWRDWIVESLNDNKPYDRMVVEMLAADEMAPEDTGALRATGFLVRNYKMLSRETWMEDTVNHTTRAFLGVTVGCAKCHNHKSDPIAQREYYQIRAIFEPHQVRIDRVPGQPDTGKDGLVRVYDVATNAPTYLYHRGDERTPDKDHPLPPGVPAALGGKFEVRPVSLPANAWQPDKRDFVIEESLAAARKAVADAQAAFDKVAQTGAPAADSDTALALDIAKLKQDILAGQVRAEKVEASAGKDCNEWKELAPDLVAQQRRLAASEAKLALSKARQAAADAQAKADKAEKGTEKPAKDKASKDLEAAKKKCTDSEKALAAAEKELSAAPSTAFKPRVEKQYSPVSSGRRLAFANWVASPENPLTARVAVNHIWRQHFGSALEPSTDDFGANARPPTHPQLLDWLAAQLMSSGWKMKELHRLIVTSSAYRMAATPDASNARLDADNRFLWRMNSRRLEAEAIRDNLLWTSGRLDLAMGGPEIDQNQGLTSKRRSLYLRTAAEKEVEFLKIFDNASVTECYERKQTVVPQQALALANSELCLNLAKDLAASLTVGTADNDAFISQAYLHVLARAPKPAERAQCREFLTQPEAARARENLVLVLFNHSDFVTVR
jgi:hypothetical protein